MTGLRAQADRPRLPVPYQQVPDLGDLVGLYGAILATVIGLRQWRRNREPLSFSVVPTYPEWTDDSLPDDRGTAPAHP